MAQGKRSYKSPTRAAQAAETRARLIAAARQLFAEGGWNGTTLKSIAKAAGVAEPTVYAVFGNKAGLAMALTDTADDEADVATLVAELSAAESPRRQIDAMVQFEARMYERAADLVRILHEGARTSPELADAYREGLSRGDAGRRRVVSAWPPGALRAGLTLQEALDVCSLAMSFELWDHLAVRGWSTGRIAEWTADMVARELLAD
ncbi:helix-turn-helix domain-containing protein [Gordonia sp. PKS22-38]|uniref:Helix-turn-helix domain-containing protein n=1 Tax=Gordonia prachuapensis TaxID=3115651 RepID=A0ABU7MZZ8_9ACTN|nr:helix-turn-helix domain-containing protein [Gordonia sp. PKS22-38]